MNKHLKRSSLKESIYFNVKESYDYLVRWGQVYSLRPKRRSNTRKVVLLSTLEGSPHYKGIVKVKFVREIDLEDHLSKAMLLCYIAQSGFTGTNEWLHSCTKFWDVLYLYTVEVLELEKKKE